MPNLFKNFINDQNDQVECVISKFADVTELGGVAAIQWNLNNPEKWVDRNLMKFTKVVCNVLHLGRKNTIH